MRALLDTNIVLDFLLVRGHLFNEANEIFIKLQNEEFEAFVSPITPVNTFYIARKMVGKDRAHELTEQLILLVSVARTDWQVLSDALTLGISDYEDAVQCSSALADGLDCIVTRNISDFANSPVTVYSPSEFLAAVAQISLS